MPVDMRYWMGRRWNSHGAFRTVSHTYISCDSPAKGRTTCILMAVQCADGRWYLEDNSTHDARNVPGVWDPYDPNNAEPRFFPNQKEVVRFAATIVASVSGVPVEDVLDKYER